MNSQENESNSCLNCKADLNGPFCSQCGQARSARLVPVHDWLGDLFGSFFKLDSKLLRTLKRIMFQPGVATLEFAYGHRVSYSGPARVYIFVSAISIAAMTLQGVFGQSFEIPGLKVDEGFQRTLQFLFPFINLFSPLMIVGILATFHRKLYLQLHLAFSLHFWSFLVAITTPLIFIPPTSVWSIVGFVCVSIIASVYLFVAHRRVYVMHLPERLLICVVMMLSVPLASFIFGAILFGLAAILS